MQKVTINIIINTIFMEVFMRNSLKKITSVLLAAAMVIGLMPQGEYAA